MKLDDWVDKIIANVMDRVTNPINQRQIVKENLRAFVQDDCVYMAVSKDKKRNYEILVEE